MTDTHGSTPGNGPVPPTQGDEHAQHAAPMGQQPYYQQQQQYYQQPQHPQHPAGGVTVEKKSHGLLRCRRRLRHRFGRLRHLASHCGR